MKFNLKKVLIIGIAIASLIGLVGCSDDTTGIDSSKPTVVCTGFAQYEWVNIILGDEAEQWNVVRINEKGADMHSYQPSADDMILIQNCDLLIYTGGVSESWIADIVNGKNFEGIAYGLLQNGDAICLEEEHEHQDGEEHDDEEYDEHIWLSLDNAEDFCQDILEKLNEISPSEAYKRNCKEYTEKIEALEDKFEEQLDAATSKIVIFADRFPFRYLAEDCDLEWYAAFTGCSAETEASFETIKGLADKVSKYGVKAVYITETGDTALAETVISNSGNENIEILTINSMQSVSKDETRGYLEIMEDNLEVLVKGLK